MLIRLTLTIVFPLISHITRGFGCPVTRQQKRAHSPSSTVTASGRLTNTGADRGLVSSTACSCPLYKLLTLYWELENKTLDVNVYLIDVLILTLAKKLPFHVFFLYSSYV